jgi:sarcosine oxidase
MSRPTVIVVGLGAVGSATALHLARAGAEVVGIDRWHPPHAMGSTHGGSRVTRATAWEGPQYPPLVARAQTLWRALAAETGAKYFDRCGGLFIGLPDEYHITGTLRSARESALEHELLDRDEIQRRWPELVVPEGMVGVVDPAAGVLDPERIVEDQLRVAAGFGAEFVFDCEVTGWAPLHGGGVGLDTTIAKVRADRVVFCTGAWMGEALDEIGLPTQVERVTQHWFEVPAGAPSRANAPVMLLSDGNGYATAAFPAVGGRIKVAGHGSGRLGRVEDVDREVHRDDINPAEALARAFLPQHIGPHRESAVCMYTRTPDGHFVIDRHPDCADVILASPCNGFGFKFSSAVGEMLAAEVLERESPVDPAPWRLKGRVREG